jgi:bifunctional DNase/RNase
MENCRKCRIQKNDYQALSFREKTTKQLIQKVISKLENSLNGIQISDYKIENIANLDKPIIESSHFNR